MAAPRPEPKSALLERVLDAIRLGGWTAKVRDRTAYPFEIDLSSEEERDALLVYIWNVSHGGGSARPQEEYRVQLTFPGQRANQSGRIEMVTDRKTLLLGHFGMEGIDGFVGWDPTQHQTPGWSASVQVRLDTIRRAFENGVAIEERKREAGVVTEVAVAFRSELLVQYIREVYPAYQPARVTSSEMAALAVEVSHVRTLIPEPPELPGERRIAVRTFLQLERSANFAKRVLDAYGDRCAFCGLQLRVLDAAHIVPVADPMSTDRTENGVALCPTHHRAFDRGILGIEQDRTIVMNERAVGNLREAGYGGGLEDFRRWSRVGDPAYLPEDPSKAPTVETLKAGLRLRGFLATIC